MKVALYARVSTEGQDPHPQLAKLREWAVRQEYIICLEAVDTATGKNMRRPGMESVMNLVRQRHVDAVAVCKIDRWARSVKDLSSTVTEIHERKAEFHAIDQGLSVKPNDPTAKLILNVLGAVADWEGSIISERTKDGLLSKVGRGRHWKDCGSAARPCPTGKHQSNGVQTAREGNGQNSPPLTNDRLIDNATAVVALEEKQTPLSPAVSGLEIMVGGIQGDASAHAHMTATPDGRFEFATCGIKEAKE